MAALEVVDGRLTVLIESSGMTTFRCLTLLLVYLLASPSVCLAADDHLLRVMTFNIRYGTAPDKENAWPVRRELALDVIRDAACDLIGLQEVLQFQLDELTAQFPKYASLGVGRDADGGGEYSAILYDRARFDVRQANTFWLSDTPEIAGSTTWGNTLPRICISARLFDRDTKRTYCVLNTHWDHQSQPSRERSGALIRDRIAKFNKHDDPVILFGDFNVGQRNAAWVPLREAGLRDSYRDLYPEVTGIGTFHDFLGGDEGDKIDAVLVSQHWQIEAAEINHTNTAGRYPSDHFPVTATLSFRERHESCGD